ncbi:YtxH domain-containing protein [Culicoidibacter larvae]|uniref:YtxH domain-containing protein n=1 Tax=Culicoidibacter larvae TaxID=2579976 RepID=A0A5R8QF79_9FIRM|nr:YtxH domain-containing protein [Culicoidibacter larvae]TLG76665.1 YtxH domain-containing protein [Culicoidibacter larvae]
MAKEKSNLGAVLTSVALGVVAGAVGGVVAGILLAPKSGKETVKDIKSKTFQIRDKAVDTAHDMRERGEHMLDNFNKNATNEAKQTFSFVEDEVAKNPFLGNKKADLIERIQNAANDIDEDDIINAR